MIHFGKTNIPTFVAGGFAGFARVKMILAAFAFKIFAFFGFDKSFGGGLMGFEFWHSFYSLTIRALILPP